MCRFVSFLQACVTKVTWTFNLETIAITSAQMVGGKIEDDWLYFGDEIECGPDQLLEKLRLQTVTAMGKGLRHSSESLVLGHERQLPRNARGG